MRLILKTNTKKQALHVTIPVYSDLIYWWPAWFYSCAAALLSYHYGAEIRFGDAHSDHVFPHTTLSSGFLLLLLFLLLLTAGRIRGVRAFMLVAGVGTAWSLIQMLPKLASFAISTPVISQNLYQSCSVVLALVWFIAVLFPEKRVVLYTGTGQLEMRERGILGMKRVVALKQPLKIDSESDFLRRLLGFGRMNNFAYSTTTFDAELWVRNAWISPRKRELAAKVAWKTHL
jgi:hypothetical protein